MKNLKIIITILLVISSISISASSKIKRQCKIVNGKITRCDSKGSNSSSLKKRIKELDEHPELNKNRKITQAQTEKIVKFILFIIIKL